MLIFWYTCNFDTIHCYLAVTMYCVSFVGANGLHSCRFLLLVKESNWLLFAWRTMPFMALVCCGHLYGPLVMLLTTGSFEDTMLASVNKEWETLSKLEYVLRLVSVEARRCICHTQLSVSAFWRHAWRAKYSSDLHSFGSYKIPRVFPDPKPLWTHQLINSLQAFVRSLCEAHVQQKQHCCSKMKENCWDTSRS